MSTDEQRTPCIGQWIRMEVSGGMAVAAGRKATDPREILGFTYVDPTHGFSLRGDFPDGGDAVGRPRLCIRLSPVNLQVPWSALGDDEVRERGLPVPPSWVPQFYGRQSPPGSRFGAWRQHPRLAGKFHPEYPDDLRVAVHDGGPRIAKTPVENMWVRVYGADGDVMSGALLNTPFHLKTLKEGEHIRFIVTANGQPLYVKDAYLAEREQWLIEPCNGCGLSELWDPPAEHNKVVFPQAQEAGGEMASFSAFCRCGGTFFVVRKDQLDALEAAAEKQAAKGGLLGRLKSWWRGDA